MSNIFDTIKIEAVPNPENDNILGTDIILANAEEIVEVDVPQVNQLFENDFGSNKKNKEFDEGYILMLGDGTFKILQSENLVDKNIVHAEDPLSIENNLEVSSRLEILQTKISCSHEGCDKKFISISQLKDHQRKHNDTSTHACDECGKKLSSSYSLKAHKRTHTGEKPYTCPEVTCQKRCKTSGDLQKHIRTHTGERPFKCTVCSKAFTTSDIRKVHMRIHTGEKPYECTHNGCDRRFSSSTNYRNHSRIHTGEKPYVCSVQSCQRRFTEYSSLYKHYSVHSQKKKYECVICNRQYRQLSTLNIHINTVHKEGIIYNRNAEQSTSHLKPIKPASKTQSRSVVSQHIILHPKNGILTPSTTRVSFQGDNTPPHHFVDLRMLNSECGVENKSEEFIYRSVDEGDSASSSSARDGTTKPLMEFTPLKAMTCGSEAILVLTVPPSGGDAISVPQIDPDPK